MANTATAASPARASIRAIRHEGPWTVTSLAAPSLAHPAGLQIYQVGIIVLAFAIMARAIVLVVRHHRPRLLYMVIAAATWSWQETYGDWGVFLLFNPKFWQFPWPFESWTAPSIAWWFPAGYVVFYTAVFAMLTKFNEVIRRRFPQRNPYLLVTAFAFPIFYVFDLLFEGTAVYLGYWSYGYTFGLPAIQIGNGQFPLVWPILEQVPFFIVATFGLTWRDRDGRDVFGVFAAKVPAIVSRGVALGIAWIVLTNIEFLVLTTLPNMTIRWLFGADGGFPEIH